MEIAFIIADQKKPHEGVVRPFLSFAKELGNCHKTSFALLRCSEELVNSLKASFQGSIIVSNNVSGLCRDLSELRPKFVIADDDFGRLKLLKTIGDKTGAATVSYVQVLYGIHAIADCFDLGFLSLKEKLMFSLIKLFPFGFFSRRYADALRKCNLIISNSKVTATFLHTLYNVDVGGIIYPPVDDQVFKPLRSKGKNRDVALYLGSHLGDSNEAFLEKIVELVSKSGYSCNLFGNQKLASILLNKFGHSFIRYEPLSDEELAAVYSKSSITICPQKWEQFGLVPIESLSCGTPVLAFNCMGFQETVIDGKTGWLANNRDSFLKILNQILENQIFPQENLRAYAIERFSTVKSSKALEMLLTETSEK